MHALRITFLQNWHPFQIRTRANFAHFANVQNLAVFSPRRSLWGYRSYPCEVRGGGTEGVGPGGGTRSGRLVDSTWPRPHDPFDTLPRRSWPPRSDVKMTTWPGAATIAAPGHVAPHVTPHVTWPGAATIAVPGHVLAMLHGQGPPQNDNPQRQSAAKCPSSAHLLSQTAKQSWGSEV